MARWTYAFSNGDYNDWHRRYEGIAGIDIDFIEYLDSGNYCFIEWPNICKDLIKEDYTEVFMNIISKDKRLIKIN